MWQAFVETIGPAILAVVGVAVTAIAYQAKEWVKTRFLAGAAQDAFANAAGGIVNKLGEELLTTILQPNDASVQQAVAKVTARVPDAIKMFNLSPAGIAERIIDHVGKLQAPAIGAMIQTPVPIASVQGGQAGPAIPPLANPVRR